MPNHGKGKWGDWSEWVWEAERQFHYRVRQDIDGNLDYDYSYGQTLSPGKDSAYASDPASPQEPFRWQTIHADQDEEDLDKKRREDERRRQKNQKKFRRPEDAKPQKYKPGDSDSPIQDTEEWATDHYDGSSYAYQPDYPQALAYLPHEDPRNANQPGSSSTSSYTYGDTEFSDHAHAPESKDPSDYSTVLCLDEFELVDPRYKVELSERFQPGQIFKVPQLDQEKLKKGWSQKRSVVFKTFLVISNDLNGDYSTCVPISTYGGKGCNAPGVKAHRHGIVYSRGSRPKLLKEEPKMGFPPIKVDMTYEEEPLPRESRVKYSELKTIEHRCPVFMIGSLGVNDWDTVQDAVNQCWKDKNHEKRSRHKR